MSRFSFSEEVERISQIGRLQIKFSFESLVGFRCVLFLDLDVLEKRLRNQLMWHNQQHRDVTGGTERDFENPPPSEAFPRYF